ncbi:hypothetical protein KUTeg_012447 [Tegillarca granosa]|uniref:Uncharacterized protein n=1 Tax=Tegillarca granosa TaxID=220873 RepID=A0ABQ9EZJ1_TEGGR|nr:hypothetical protein KUTeg_012447 [Tegillarca granosa]
MINSYLKLKSVDGKISNMYCMHENSHVPDQCNLTVLCYRNNVFWKINCIEEHHREKPQRTNNKTGIKSNVNIMYWHLK